MLNHNYKTYIAFDILFIGTLNNLITIFNFTNNYFSIYEYYKKYGKNNLIQYLQNHKFMNNHNDFDHYIEKWIAMPESNFEFYLKYQHIPFVKLHFFNCIQR